MDCVTKDCKIGSRIQIRVARLSGDSYIDLRPYTAESFISHALYGKYEMETAHSVEIIDGQTIHSIIAFLDADDTAELRPGKYIWDMAITHNTTGDMYIYPENHKIQINFLESAGDYN